MAKVNDNALVMQALRVVFNLPVLLVLMALEAASRRPALACCVGPDLSDDAIRARENNPLSGLPIWDDEPETLDAFAVVAAVNVAAQPMPSAPQVTTAEYARPVEDLDEIGWDDVIPFTVREWDVEDPDAVIPYAIPAASRPSTAAPADLNPTVAPSTRAKPAGVDVVQRALALIAEGKSKREAARLLHVPDSTLRRWISQRTTATA